MGVRTEAVGCASERKKRKRTPNHEYTKMSVGVCSTRSLLPGQPFLQDRRDMGASRTSEHGKTAQHRMLGGNTLGTWGRIPPPDCAYAQKSKRFGVQSILLVDDHPLMREGLRKSLEAEMDLRVTGAAGSGEEALECLEEVRPDLLITDLSLEGMDGLELTRRATERCPELPVLVVSRHEEDLYARKALQAGARGYLMKDAASDQLVEAARTVARGRRYLSDAAEDRIEIDRNEEQPAAMANLLSDRELMVFDMLGRGESVQAIAAEMAISTKTVQSYIRRIREKLDIGSTEKLRRRALVWLENQ